MKFKDFRQYFSASRVNRYLIATGNSTGRAVKLYKANLKVSQTFHPLLGILEVVLRNRLNDILTAHFTDPDWTINKAKESCKTTGEAVSGHFVDVNKMVKISSGAEKLVGDIMLTRYVCYLTPQNGDPKKEQIAFAQSFV